MRLLVKRGFSLLHDMHFTDGPIYIGRLSKCRVYLPDRNVSRQHAVIYTTNDGIWMIQDLESSNCTTLNGRPISKMPLHEGDTVGVADFALEVHFEPESDLHPHSTPLDLEDTIIDSRVEIPTIFETARKDSKPLHISSQRLHDFYQFVMALSKKDDQEQLLTELTKILIEQFTAYNVWGGLREMTSGPLTCYCGRNRNGEQVSLDALLGKNIIKQALKNENYILLPNFADYFDTGDSKAAGLARIKSAMAAPIFSPVGVFGVIYINNGIDQEAFNRQDMDYLTLLSIYVAALVEHIA
ncbi:MAG: FHA domain-containing protein [Sedimentisphaerales bacterium]|nr:FHA domain-containing protein [Sedimentisphaerales bacterium]